MGVNTTVRTVPGAFPLLIGPFARIALKNVKIIRLLVSFSVTVMDPE
jgi:hypothetical protein